MAAVVVGCSCLASACEKAHDPAAPAPGLTPKAATGTPLIETQRDAMIRAYRLEPDRRFLVAFTTARAVLTGESRSPITPSFAQGAWHLMDRGVEIGSLPELPSYDDAFSLLVTSSAALLKTHPVTGPAGTEPPDLLGAGEALALLESTSAAWTRGERSPSLLQKAARGLVSLQLQTYDGLEMTDEIEGRAIALVALVKATGGDSAAYEAMLAKALGYWDPARAIVATMPASSVARAFVLHDDAVLEPLAAQPGASEATRGLFLRRLCIRSERALEQRWILDHLAASAYSPSVLFVRLFAPDLGTERAVSLALPDFVLLTTMQKAGDPRAASVASDLQGWTDINAFGRAADKIRADLDVPDSTMLDVFEAAVTKLGVGLTGPIFDASTEQAFFRANMYGALDRGAIHTVHNWNSKPAAEAFLSRWGTAGGAPAADFRWWMRELIDAQWGKAGTGELLSTIKDLPSFGSAPARRLYDQLAYHADWGDPRTTSAVRTVVSRMDTRLENRRTLYHIALEGVHDLSLAERLGRTLLAESQPLITSAETSAAWLLQDAGWYKARLADPETRPGDAVALLVAQESLGTINDATARAEMRKRLASVSRTWSPHTTFFEYLLKKQAYDQAKAVAQEWLSANPHTPGLDPVLATNAVARALRAQGNYAEAWKVLEPVIVAGQGDSMAIGASLLDALGRADDAEKLAEQRLDRYPFVGAVAALTELYWRHGKNTEAAKLLAPSSRVALTVAQMRWDIGPGFLRAFDKRQDADALAAFQAMQGTDALLLSGLAAEVNKTGKHRLAFDMNKSLSAPGWQTLEYLVPSYGYLKAASNHEQALAWLKASITPPLLDPLCMFAFRDGHDELLWELVPTPAPSRHDAVADTIWLFRAASVARGASEAHRAEVMAHYAASPVGEEDDISGRYLLGIAGQEKMLPAGDEARSACEVAYWLGYKAQLERRNADATLWYRVAAESGQFQTFEYRQATNQLYDWYSAGKQLSLL
jgi:hypothetical protein